MTTRAGLAVRLRAMARAIQAGLIPLVIAVSSYGALFGFAVSAATPAPLQPAASRISGVVVDTAGDPLPGVEITIESRADAKAVTDARGVFAIVDLQPGDYVVEASLPGFRRKRLPLSLPQQTSQPLKIVLRVSLFSETPLYFVPEPRDAIRSAAAIARVRLDGFADAKIQCDDLVAIAAVHEATVIEVWTGTLPKSIQIWEDGIGSCMEEDGTMMSSYKQTSAHLIGSEYVIFLHGKPPRFGGLGDMSNAFLVTGSSVETNGFMGLPKTMILREFRQRLQRAAR